MFATPELYNSVLIDPIIEGCDSLRIISGYATHAMASHHIESIIKRDLGIKNIELLIGMAVTDGISDIAHRGFIELCNGVDRIIFSCSYITTTPPVHSKAYCWLKDSTPVKAFVGSCNYTQNAFIRGQREVCAPSDPNKVHDYIDSLVGDSIYCHHSDAKHFTEIYAARRIAPIPEEQPEFEQQDADYFADDLRFQGLESAEIDLLDRSGNVPQISGLNWGQRDGRERNQAYLSIRGDLKKTDFFPPRGEHFSVLTDDGASLLCSRAQADGKAIHTPLDNSKMGEYFRMRLGLESGAFVTKEAIARYGRSLIRFYKIDDENYYMDFSRP